LGWQDATVGRRADQDGYRALGRVAGYRSLIAAVSLSRLANAMSQIGVVIYLLDRSGSAVVAGAGAAAQLLPGVVSGPLIGAWFDRTASRRAVIVATQTVRAALLVGVVAAGELWHAPAAVELALLAGLGVTFPVANVGFRSMVPAMVPERLWVTANAADSVSYDASYVAGPALAAAAVTWLGAPAAILVQAAATLVAGLVALRVADVVGMPRTAQRPLAAALTGLRVVWRHQQLRATVVLMVLSGLGYGCFTIGLPLWARGSLGASAGAAGWMWASLSCGSVIGGLAYGWRRPAGSDANHVVLFTALFGVPLLAVPFCRSVTQALVVMFTAGLVMAPFIIAMFSIRQHAVSHDLHGRIFAITISINATAAPLGAFLAGVAVPVIGVHRLLFGAGIGQLVAATAAWMLLRAAGRPLRAAASSASG
jgi:hypothetical protein